MSTRQSGFAGKRSLARKAALTVALAASLAACSSGKDSSSGAPEVSRVAFTGAAFADEPQAALVGRKILSGGGNAADAAAAMGFMMGVTLPSRASLGAGGACLVYDPSATSPLRGSPEAVLFYPVAGANPAGADRPASAPMLARGMFALHARYGALRPASIIGPAEQAARLGLPVSRALSRDMSVVAGPLGGDPAVRAVFYSGDRPLAEGATLVQPQLAATLSRLRDVGIGDLYLGEAAQTFVSDMPRAGGGLSLADVRGAAPQLARAWVPPGAYDDQLALLPPSERGAIATAAAAASLLNNSKDVEAANQRALAAAAAAKQGDLANEKLLSGQLPAGTLGPLPASATFGAVDARGQAVVCGVSMNNLFGTGRIAQRSGIMLAASPARFPPPLLSIAILLDRGNNVFHGMAAGSGQEGAAGAAAIGLAAGLTGKLPAQPPEPGRANVIFCRDGVPKGGESCVWSSDPRGFGVAVGAN